MESKAVELLRRMMHSHSWRWIGARSNNPRPEEAALWREVKEYLDSLPNKNEKEE